MSLSFVSKISLIDSDSDYYYYILVYASIELYGLPVMSEYCSILIIFWFILQLVSTVTIKTIRNALERIDNLLQMFCTIANAIRAYYVEMDWFVDGMECHIFFCQLLFAPDISVFVL